MPVTIWATTREVASSEPAKACSAATVNSAAPMPTTA